MEKGRDFDVLTVSGWIMEEIGRIPQEGDSFNFENLTVTVLSMKDKRVDKAGINVGLMQD